MTSSAYFAPYLLKNLIDLSLPLKQNSIFPWKTFSNVSCGILVHKVEKEIWD